MREELLGLKRRGLSTPKLAIGGGVWRGTQ